MHGKEKAVSTMHGKVKAVSTMHDKVKAVRTMHGEVKAVFTMHVTIKRYVHVQTQHMSEKGGCKLRSYVLWRSSFFFFVFFQRDCQGHFENGKGEKEKT